MATIIEKRTIDNYNDFESIIKDDDFVKSINAEFRYPMQLSDMALPSLMFINCKFH
ncbi:MAG: hypothetical protein GY834_00005 [Bacteroidetes bacterium]|nr:hypothetical protein [Bacteroidota bacterium]